MENRWSERRPLALDVDLYYRDKPYFDCHTRDVGLGGMFIELARDGFPRYSKVDLVLRLRRDGLEKSHRFRARVVRNTDGGIAVSFRDFNKVDFRVLQEALSPNASRN